MTYSRAACSGYLVADRCPMCGRRGDTMRHRIWRCRHPDVVAARDAVAPQWLQREQDRRAEDDSFWVTGWIPHPADTWPAPADVPTAIVTYGESEEGDPPACEDDRAGLAGHLYGDGSCTTHVYKELRRAGTSVIQRTPGSTVIKRIRCPVAAPLPQTPQAAEFMVVALVQQMAAQGRTIDLALDCLNVVRDLNSPFSVAAGARRMQAGISRLALTDGNWKRQVTVRKVKAHVDPAKAPTEDARQDAIGNNWADREAKAAAAMHPQPSPALVGELEAALKRAKIVVQTIAKVTQIFPPSPRNA
jgi:hypothetical protein